MDLWALLARSSGAHAGCIMSSQAQTAHDESAALQETQMRWHRSARIGGWKVRRRTGTSSLEERRGGDGKGRGMRQRLRTVRGDEGAEEGVSCRGNVGLGG
jgi:hypothetical protein